MDQARLIIAIALSFLVFLIWELLPGNKSPIQPQKEVEKTYLPRSVPEDSRKGVSQGARSEHRGAEKIPGDIVASGPPEPARIITVSTPLYTVEISEKGAVFRSFVLKDYRETMAADAPFLEMIDPEIDTGILQLDFADKSVRGLPGAVFLADRPTDIIVAKGGVEPVSFFWMSPEGVRIEKTFFFDPSSYLIELRVTVRNGSSQSIRDHLMVSLKKRFEQEGRRFGFEGPSALINNSRENVDLDDIADKNSYTGSLQWMTVQDRYFMISIIPETPVAATMHLSYPEETHLLTSQYIAPEMVVQPGTEEVFSYQLFLGPKDTSILETLGFDLKKAVYFGWFDPIAKPCVWVMNLFYSIIPNYGVAIILLTLLSKILLWPLGVKSYKSMAEMKKVQPLMADLREKYKDDKQKMNQEVMALYRTYKVNPLGGCLPMLVQMPLFFALYRMLYEAIELRHAPFFGWIKDLSAPERLELFPISYIPVMEPPYGIPVLTIIMGATMFLSQKMQPPMGDPAQAKMMMFMPVIFTVFFINFSSGLVLYWLVNNVLSIAQQQYVTKKLA
ncbi:MAG: membrane protein insertase YidC [Desulfobacterales bacterium]